MKPEEWGVPDWRNGKAYPKPTDLTHREWAWEFLRRHPAYREAWLRNSAAGTIPWCSTCYALGVAIDEEHFSDSTDGLIYPRLIDVIIDPAHRLSDEEMSYLLPKNDGYLTHPKNGQIIEGAYRTAKLFPESHLQWNVQAQKKRQEWEEGEGIVHFVFNLSKPLEPQIQQASTALAEAQRLRGEGKRVIRRPRRGNIGEPNELGGFDTPVAGNDPIGIVDEDWVGEPEARDGARALFELLARVRARVVRSRPKGRGWSIGDLQCAHRRAP